MKFNLADLFEKVADAVPDRLALVAGDRRLTYRELDERAILSAYLPEELDDGPLEALVDEALAAGGFTEPSQMGPAMNAVMAAVAGRAEGKRVSAMVKAKLAG